MTPCDVPVYDRMLSAVKSAREGGCPDHEILNRALQQLVQPSVELIQQGCVALVGKQRELQDAKWSVDRHELAAIKMKFRWRAMVKAIMRGM